ncbi:MAG: tRNA pseudouridine(55) synthase TruB [Ktedonobacteraceae bacterium]|nr:tRNA pseudouridine(55) synthase TruB [Ktedonobacteraceae bacterium]
MDGILNINKATGMTSHDVVAKIRKLLKQKRVGHAGTLDPAASGVLPICIGLGTRVAEYLSESGKAYRAVIHFGIVTDTYDTEGSILRTSDASGLTLARIEEALPHFLGAQMQVPPLYSAIKLQGQPAYKRIRAGEEITLEARPIVIYALRIVNWQAPQLTLDIECSKGTYIRSLAYDMGEYLGYGAHLSTLVRTRSGPFTLEKSILLEHLAEIIEQGTLATCVFPPDSALRHYPALYLDEITAQRVLHGNTFHYDQSSLQPESDLARIYNRNGNFLAIAGWNAVEQVWQPKKVFGPGNE